MAKYQRGMVIVLEGLDRVGKSTQCKQLIESLRKQGRRAELIRFPDRTLATGKLISEYLSGKTNINGQTVHLLFTANRWELFPRMLDLLNSGTTLVIDRYSYSGIAYSSAKGLDFDWCKAAENGLIKPDCVLYLKNDIKELTRRDNFGDEIYEKEEFQQIVHKMYMKLVDSNWNVSIFFSMNYYYY